LLLASTVGFAVLTLPISLPLWERLPLLSYVQFPWRFLGPAAFCTALLAGIATASPVRGQGPGTRDQGPASIIYPPTSNLQSPTSSTLLAAILTTLLVLGNLGWFYPRHCSPSKDTSIAGMIAWERATDTLGTTAKGEYMPIWVHQMPQDPALDAAYAAGGAIARLPLESLPAGVRVLHADYGPVDATLTLDSPSPFRARYLAFYYPGWSVTVDGHPVAVAPTDPDGLVSFDVPAGSHTIRVRFGETPLRLTADVLSLLSLAALLLLTCPRIRHHALRITHHASRTTRHELALILITLSFLVAFSLNLSPYLRGPAEWRWTYAVPSSPGRLGIPAVSLALYLMLTLVWIRQATKSTGVARWLSALLLLALVLAVPAIQASLLAVGQSDVLQPLFYRTVSPGASGVFSVGSIIEDPGDFLRRYPALMPTFPVHPQRYPPGLPLLFYVTRRWLEKMPVLADRLGFALRLYQCHDLALMRLPNATIASAVVQMALPLISGFTLLPLYGLVRLAYGRQAAAWTAALYPLVSSFALWSGRWEQFYPLLTCTSWYFFYLGLTRPYARRLGSLLRCAMLLVAGFVLSIASLLNFGMLALLLPMGLSAFVWLLTHPERYRHRWAEWIAGALAFLAGLASLWIAYQLAFGTGFLDIWRVSMSLHLGLNRSYWTWVGYHLYDFFIFLGLPLALLFLIALVGAIRDLGCRRYDALALGIALGLLLLDLSGTSQGEVARVWLFLTPLAVLVAARGLVRLRLGERGFVIVASLLALHLFTFNAFLRIVTTGLTDPPPHARVFEPPAVAHPLSARFGDPAQGVYPIALLGYDLEPDALLPGDVLHLTLYWQPLQPIARSYTVFTHLVGADHYLAGQQDNMPLTNTLPTTCWVPGEIVADPYNIPIATQATPGDYVVETGFYILETGERLPTSGSTATPDGRVILQTISVGAERSR
jgi:hypothetical protein